MVFNQKTSKLPTSHSFNFVKLAIESWQQMDVVVVYIDNPLLVIHGKAFFAD